MENLTSQEKVIFKEVVKFATIIMHLSIPEAEAMAEEKVLNIRKLKTKVKSKH